MWDGWHIGPSFSMASRWWEGEKGDLYPEVKENSFGGDKSLDLSRSMQLPRYACYFIIL